MNKLKLFIENFLVYGLGGIISKIIPLIMLPIVTRIMPSSEYFGINDMSNTIVSFASALALMGMYDAMYRMFFEKEDEKYKKIVCSTALVFTFTSSLVVFVTLLLCREWLSSWFFGSRQYSYVVYLSAMATLVGATNGIISAPTRMQNNRKVYLAANALGPIISYSISIPMLLAGHYVIALPLSAVISGLTLELAFGFVNRKWFDFKLFDKKLLKQMLLIAIPLMPNFLVYWLFNSCDKVMISNIIGLGAAGIYAVGSKLGSASQLIYMAFAGGWQFFAFSTMKEENQVKSNSLVFEYLGVISFVAAAFICACSYDFFRIVFEHEYLTGYIIAPYLFLAPLLQMLYQVASNQFLVVKKTWPTMLILLSGAVLNIILNYYLIPVLGIEGASIATLMGYVCADVVCVVVLCRMKLMEISSRFIFAVATMVMYMLIWRVFFSNSFCSTAIAAICFTLVMLYLYRAELRMILDLTRNTRPQ